MISQSNEDRAPWELARTQPGGARSSSMSLVKTGALAGKEGGGGERKRGPEQ